MDQTAPHPPLKTTILLGSVRQERLAGRILEWLISALKDRPEIDLNILDPRDLGLTPWHGDMDQDTLGRLRLQLSDADGFLVLTPEYNHSFPGALKSLIDAGKDEWARKPVGFVSYGGISGGLRAVEQLRLVFAELRSHTLRDTVSFANPWTQIDAHKRFLPAEQAWEALHAQIDDYLWWARLLSAGRAAG